MRGSLRIKSPLVPARRGPSPCRWIPACAGMSGAVHGRLTGAERDCMRPLAPISNTTRVLLGISFFVLFVAVWAFATFGGYVSKTFLADPLHHGAGRLGAADQVQFLLRHRGHDLARGRRLRDRGPGRGADRHPDGRLQADRGVSRTVRFLRALSAGVGLHSASDPVGRHRRIAEAARHLHRLGVPDHPDGGARDCQRAARSGGSRADARRARPGHPRARA